MLVVADENIPYVEEAFASFGRVVTLPGRAIRREVLRDAGLLLVRSVTQVDAALLEGTAVSFVGSATIGTDHVALEELASLGIPFAHAPGSNAESVVEYVLAALLAVASRRGKDVRELTIGVVGCGTIGGRVRDRFRALGCRVVENDPPLERKAEAEGEPHKYVALDRLLGASDVVTMHVPLTKGGPDPTFRLLDAVRLSRMRNGALLINTSRGAVVDNRDLLDALRSGRVGGAVLDVWEGEPEPDAELVGRTTIATPHIAGYSFDGKVAGTAMLVEAASRALEQAAEWSAEEALAESGEDRLDLEQPDGGLSLTEWLHTLASRAYPIREDDSRFRAYLHLPRTERGAFFVACRKSYPRRRAFGRFRLPGDGLDEDRRRAASEFLGFHLI